MTFKYKKLVLVFSLVLSIITLLIGTTNIFGADDETFNQSQEISPTMLEAEQYANHYGVSINEALNRFKLMDSFPGLENELAEKESSTFGGLWIQHEPEFKLVIAFTSNGQETIGKYISQLPSHVEVREVTSSYIDLEKLHSDLETKFMGLKISSISGVDVVNNCVEFKLLNADKGIFTNAINDGTISLSDKINIGYINALPVLQTSTVYGGLPMATEGKTIGFSVKNSAGTRGFITCAHGPTATAIDSVEGNYVSVSYQSGSLGGNYDTSWYTCAAGTTINRNCRYYNDGDEWNPDYWVKPVTSVKYLSLQREGDIVSKYGKTTFYTAGQISNLAADVTLWDPYAQVSRSYTDLVEVENTLGYDILCDGGDSGGPWFVGDGSTGLKACGTHIGGGDDIAYYMPIDRISVLGVSVLTQTP